MKPQIPQIVFILLSILTFSCNEQREIKTLDDSYKYFNLENAGWKSKSVSHNLSDIDYTATLVPIQYYIIRNEGLENPSQVDSIYEKLKNERVVEMEFRHTSRDDLLKSRYTNTDYESAVNHMAFDIKDDFKAVTQSGDTIDCSGVTFERSFQLAPFKKLLLHFGGIPENDKIQLIYQDQLFGNGTMKFKFKETPLKL